MTIRSSRPPRPLGLRRALALYRWLWRYHHDAALLLHVTAGELAGVLLLAIALQWLGVTWSLPGS